MKNKRYIIIAVIVIIVIAAVIMIAQAAGEVNRILRRDVLRRGTGTFPCAYNEEKRKKTD